MHWQVQEAKQKFSEVLRQAATGEPQFVTRHGEEVAVVVDIGEYHRLRGRAVDLRDFLLTAPDDELAEALRTVTAGRDLPREVDFGED